MTSTEEPPDRERDLTAIRQTYERYRLEGRSRLWDPMNLGYARMMQDRDTALVELMRMALPLTGGDVLDLGSGDGRLALVARDADLPIRSWTGVDLDVAEVNASAAAYPWASFVQASGDDLPFPDAGLDVVVASTLFSSFPSTRLEAAVAAEIARVLRPSGWLLWYDLRVDNPWNRGVHGIDAARLRELFPGWRMRLRRITLAPPISRRLGPMTRVAYPVLHWIPLLRSHLTGSLQRPSVLPPHPEGMTSAASSPDQPSVTLVVPIRNESRTIDQCLEALSEQTYPRDLLQIIVVDGESTDDSEARVASWMERDERIVLMKNPDRLMAFGLNLGIGASRTDVIGVIGGHSTVESDYVERSVEALRRTGAWCVGARVKRESSTLVQRAIARAASSPIGVGDSRHNYATQSGWAETAFPGVWHRWVFERIGAFDVAMAYNEDNELSHRILATGGRIWFEASIVVRYVPRGSLGAVFTQYRRYGRGKVGVFRKHRRALRWRHLVPPAWVAWLPASAIAGRFAPAVWLASAVRIATYAGLLFATALRGRRPGDPVLLTVAAFAAIHAGYGIGVWQGVLDLVRRA